jgi:hypothetical protein
MIQQRTIRTPDELTDQEKQAIKAWLWKHKLAFDDEQSVWTLVSAMEQQGLEYNESNLTRVLLSPEVKSRVIFTRAPQTRDGSQAIDAVAKQWLKERCPQYLLEANGLMPHGMAARLDEAIRRHFGNIWTLDNLDAALKVVMGDTPKADVLKKAADEKAEWRRHLEAENNMLRAGHMSQADYQAEGAKKKAEARGVLQGLLNLKRATEFRIELDNILSWRGRSHAVTFKYQKENLAALLKKYGDVPVFKKEIVDRYREIPD